MRALLAHSNARRYLSGQALSLLGSSTVWLACGIWIKTLTGSSAAAGLTFLFFTAPAVLAPPAGLLVDSVSRRGLIIVINLAGAGAAVPLFLVHGQDDIWIIYAVMVLFGMINLLVIPAQSALLTELLPDGLLGSANGLLRTLQESLRIVAPLLGAGLFAVAGGRAVAIFDIVAYLGAAALAASLHRVPLAHRAAAPAEVTAAAAGSLVSRTRTRAIARALQFGRETGAGFTFIMSQDTLRRLTVACAVTTLVFGFDQSIYYAIVDGLHRTTEFIGIIRMAIGVGAVVGGLSAASAIKRWGEIRVTTLGMIVFAIGPAIMCITNLQCIIAGTVLYGFGLPWIVISIITFLQRRSPPSLQGRTLAAFEVVTTGPQTISIGLGALLITLTDYRVLLGIQSAVLMSAAWYLGKVLRAQKPAAAQGQDSRADLQGHSAGLAEMP